MPQKKFPITRNNMFFSQEDFNYEISLGMDYIQQDINQNIILYEVDLAATNTNSIYKEAGKDEIRFKVPKEVPCIYEIDDSVLKTYNNTNSTGVYAISGNLTIGIYEQTLRDLKCDIKRGDYIGVVISSDRMIYFTVTNDGKMNTDNQHTYNGTVPYYRTVTCTVITEAEFKGR
ncbi:hypothetical protein EZS27_007744 [termite gut metagenome]|uniref:Uncharacterized protein n=1 Tax=termite gut metagenome TaxID=433724 RepID=A0A5J4SES8_9ZZZZ